MANSTCNNDTFRQLMLRDKKLTSNYGRLFNFTIYSVMNNLNNSKSK